MNLTDSHIHRDRQTTINRNGHIVDSTIYGEGNFSLYKNGNDW